MTLQFSDKSARSCAFAADSCTLFSPKLSSPRLAANRATEAGTVLLTGNRRTSERERPARLQALLIRCSRSSRFARSRDRGSLVKRTGSISDNEDLQDG